MRAGATLYTTRLHPVAPPVPRSPESVASSVKGVWDSGANGCDLVKYEVAPGRTSSSTKFGIRGQFKGKTPFSARELGFAFGGAGGLEHRPRQTPILGSRTRVCF